MAERRAYPDAHVRVQLERILASGPFRNSRRASAMLRYVVERALAGESDSLKERTIGVEVFGRAVSYDTANDHIVRSTAGDIRRRLAQYYQENLGAGDPRIDFAPGSYVPQFGADSPAVSSAALERFWAPLLNLHRPLLLCIGGPGLAPVLADNTPAPQKDQLTLAEVFALETEKVAFSDAVTLAVLAGFFASHGTDFRVAHESEVGLHDLRQSPAVLIGALNNDWGLRLAHELRFTFNFEPETQIGSILDRGAPAWSIRLDLPFASIREDRGVVTRIMNRTTGLPMVLAAGVTMLGTLAAGELLTNPAYMPEGEWERPNAQILFATDVLRGFAAPPRVLQTCFW
jgi:hypothetical protein